MNNTYPKQGTVPNPWAFCDNFLTTTPNLNTINNLNSYIISSILFRSDIINDKIECTFNEKPNNTFIESIKLFGNIKYELKFKYAKLMFKNISLTLLVPSLRYLKRSVLYFAYGLIDLITLKIFKISLISKYYPRNK